MLMLMLSRGQERVVQVTQPTAVGSYAMIVRAGTDVLTLPMAALLLFMKLRVPVHSPVLSLVCDAVHRPKRMRVTEKPTDVNPRIKASDQKGYLK